MCGRTGRQRSISIGMEARKATVRIVLNCSTVADPGMMFRALSRTGSSFVYFKVGKGRMHRSKNSSNGQNPKMKTKNLSDSLFSEPLTCLYYFIE